MQSQYLLTSHGSQSWIVLDSTTVLLKQVYDLQPTSIVSNGWNKETHFKRQFLKGIYIRKVKVSSLGIIQKDSAEFLFQLNIAFWLQHLLTVYTEIADQLKGDRK